MLERLQLKSGKNSYDPQVGAAAQANSALAQRAQDFTEKYYQEHITPLLDQQSALAKNADDREQQLFDINKQLTDQANQRYQQYGIPAENSYYDMVKKYSAPAEEETQAEGAIGDARVAAAGQKAGMYRQLASLGVDPTSPAAIASMGDAAVQQGAIEAASANKARQAAKTLGMSLTADAANFGRGGTSQIIGFGNAASGNLQTGSNIVGGALAGATSGATPVLQGYGLGAQAYGSNMAAYTSLQKAQMDQNGQAASGLGNFVGTVAGAAIMHSDPRLKKNVKKLAHSSFGVHTYEFNYTWEPDDAPKHVGYMSNEVKRVYPEAVSTDPSGFEMVDYSKVAA